MFVKYCFGIVNITEEGDNLTKLIDITIETNIYVPLELVWESWNEAKQIVNWNHASDDWYSPSAENDFKVEGKFVYHMEAKDGSF